MKVPVFVLCALLGPLAFAEAFVVKKGDSLESIAVQAYGHRYTAALLGRYNDVDAKRLRIGRRIEAPPLDELVTAILAEPGYRPHVKPLVDLHRRFDRFYRQGVHDQGEADAMASAIAAIETKAQEDKALEGNKSFFRQIRRARKGLERLRQSPEYRTGDYWMEDVYQPLALALLALART